MLEDRPKPVEWLQRWTSPPRHDLVSSVHPNKEYLILEKDGIPIAGIMDLDEFEDNLGLQDPEIRAIIARGHQEYLAG